MKTSHANRVPNKAISEALKNLIKAEDPSFSALYAFNFLPSRSLHPDWLAKIPAFKGMSPQAFSKLTGSSHHDVALNTPILESFNIRDQACFDFASYQSRMALMQGADLENIILHAGVLLHAHWINKLLAGKDIRAVKEVIGEETYEFSVKRLPFLFSWIDELQDFSKPPKKLGPALLEQVKMDGARLLYQWLAVSSDAIKVRISLKLPVSLDPSVLTTKALAQKYADFDRVRLDNCFKKLIREVVPLWAHLFK